MISLAFAIVASRIYPTVKYAMGHGKACTRIVVGGAPIAFDRRRRICATRMTTDPSASFEPHRRRLLGLAYRMLGSMAEAEDAVQEAYLRWHDADREQRRGAEGVSDHHDDEDLSGRAEVGACAARGVRRAVAARSCHRHRGAGARYADRDGRRSLSGAAADAGPAVSARARGISAARRVRLFVHAGGRRCPQGMD